MRVLTRKEFQDDMAKAWSEAVEAEYKAQIDEAVAAEREACAKVCESLWRIDGQHSADEFAAEIRARGQA